MAKKPKASKKKKSLYAEVITAVFERHFRPGLSRFDFARADLLKVMADMGLDLTGDEKTIARNIGDIIYSFRFRKSFPEAIDRRAPAGKMWIILGRGDAKYEFRLITIPKLAMDESLQKSKLHDATPEIVRRFKLSDEQAVLARIRYNRLVDLFCRCVAYSLQNHLRTKVEGVGQIEVDELYVAANRQGEHFIIPLQAKSEGDRVGVSQLIQDLEYCRLQHPDFKPRAVAAQMVKRQCGGVMAEVIVMFEFSCTITEEDVSITKLNERHFVLLQSSSISKTDFDEAVLFSQAKGESGP
jgi:hypothetical protein